MTSAPRDDLPGRDTRAVRHPEPRGRESAADHPSTANPPSTAVIGGGIAGLAAATCLAERGVRVRLLERADYLGGRAGGWQTTLHDGAQVTMNRGFHAFFRQYYNLRTLLRRGDPELRGLLALPDYPLLHRNGLRDTFVGLPRAPLWNALAFVARSPTFTWRDVTKLGTRAALPLADVRVPEIYHQLDQLDAASFLDRIRFPEAAKHLAFDVFSRSFFAEPGELSAAELATMFHIYFLGSNEGLLFDVASDCFPLSLWKPLAAHLRKHGARIDTGTPIDSIEREGQRFRIHGRTDVECVADAVVLATDVAALRNIVDRSPDLGDAEWRALIQRQGNARPFLVSRLWLDRPVRPDRPAFLGTSGFGPLDNISVLDRYEDTAARWAQRTGGSVIELHSYALPGSPTVDSLRPRTLSELHAVYPETAKADIVDERHELRSDCPQFAPGGFTDRPPVITPEPNLVLAGDCVRTDLPVALMERAATTGIQAANSLLARWGVRGHELWTVPDRGRYAPLRRLAALAR